MPAPSIAKTEVIKQDKTTRKMIMEIAMFTIIKKSRTAPLTGINSIKTMRTPANAIKEFEIFVCLKKLLKRLATPHPWLTYYFFLLR